MACRTRKYLLAFPLLALLALLGAALFAPIPGSAAQDPNEAKTRELALKQRDEAMDMLQRQTAVLMAERQKKAERNRALRNEIIERCELSPENVTVVLLRLEQDAFRLRMEGPPKGVRLDALKNMIAEMDKRAQVDPHKPANDTGRLLQQVQDLTLDVVESETRQELTKQRIKALRAVQGLVDEYMLSSTLELPRIDKAVDAAETQLLQLRLGK